MFHARRQILRRIGRGGRVVWPHEALVRQALEHSSVFVFGELLECPNVQALQGEFSATLDLLRIFAYGTFSDYKARTKRRMERCRGD
ncbi:COP9 signalosome complex subunit 7 (Signalosome subunit 7) [Durusdinium trenchii]|uniref:COP9 signalosome complex subunit 7 (Signalosome subunit 7) n=1 Tax=Durusdinium trenchii TaxID=1381693 RepID=A0ABP0SE57_9DINO